MLGCWCTCLVAVEFGFRCLGLVVWDVLLVVDCVAFWRLGLWLVVVDCVFGFLGFWVLELL